MAGEPMSEHKCDHFDLWLWLVIALVSIVIVAVNTDRDHGELRDAQRRIAVLEQER